MKLHELRKLITESHAEDWHRVHVPLYHQTLGTVTGHDDGERTDRVEVESHYWSLTFRDDVDLTIQYGLPMDGADDNTRSFEWAAKFPDPKVRAQYVDIFWAGTLVDRYMVLSADGGHALLPMPSTGGNRESGWRDEVTKREVAVTSLIAKVQSDVDDVAGSVQRVGFVVIADED